MKFHSNVLTKELKSYGPVRKRQIAVASSSNKKGYRNVNHGLIRVNSSGVSVTVVYEPFRKVLELLPNQEVNIEVDANGVKISHRNGFIFLNHLNGYETSFEIPLNV